MAFLLTLIVVTSLVYQDGYRILAQEIAPQEQAEVQTMSLEENTGEEPQETASAETEDQIPAADPTPVTEESGAGTEEGGPGTGESVTGGENAGSDASQDVPTPTPEEEPAADITGEQETVTTPTETPAADPTETPAADPTATPVDPTTVPTETPAAEPTETPAEPTPTATPEPTQVPEEIVLVEQSLSVSTGDATVTLQGVMPEGATVQAVPVQVAIEGQEVLAAYDITIYDAKGQVYQPQEGAIKVDIVNAAVAEAAASAEEVSVYHMDNAAAAPQEVAAAPTGDGVTFQAESFSIYVVTKPEDHYTVTYTFYDEDRTTVINQQILSKDETLNRPETPEATQNRKFVGWVYENEREFSDANFGKTAGDLNGSPLTESSTVDLYAKYEPVYYVYYMSGNDADSHILHTQTYTDGAEIEWREVPFKTSNVNQALVGWSQTPNADDPETDLFVNGADITLYPVVKEAHWITYESRGGSIVDPAYVLAGEVTRRPQDPTRTGYRFDGWYTDPECRNLFGFGSELNENITLYAGWEEAQTTYTVIYWQQRVTDNKNASDNEKSYDYAGRDVRYDTTGATVTANRNDMNQNYTGFHYNSNKQLSVTVAADGSTILNVYYDRDLITLNFYVEGRRGNYTLEDTMTGLYGSTLEANGEKWPSESNWKYYHGWLGGSTTQTYMDAFIPPVEVDGNTVDFYETSKGSVEIKHYIEDLNGNWVLKAETTGTNNATFNFSNKFNGFTVSAYSKYEEGHYEGPIWNPEWVEGGWTDWVDCKPGDRVDDYSDGLGIRHKRNLYTLDYVSQNTTIKSEDIKYEAPLESYGDFIPQHPEDLPDYYHFEGWYKDPDCTEKFDFSVEMPANDLVVYAKWTPEPIIVSFDTDGGTYIEPQTIPAGTTAERPEDPTKDGYTFAGWTRDEEPFNFGTQLIEDTKLTAQWISDDSYLLRYDPGAGTGDPVIDQQRYADQAEAKLQGVPDDWKQPNEKEGFICWNTEEDGTGTDYYPGAAFTISAEAAEDDGNGNKVITLYAKWAEGRKTTLTYEYNGGHAENDASVTSETEEIVTPNKKYPITKDGSGIVRDGYVFIGWSTSQDGSDGILKVNDEIQVDTLNPETNVLYAQWKEAVTITVAKTVSGSMGDRNKEFKFTYTVNGGNLQEQHLKHGESFEIKNLKPGDTISVTEVNGGKEGYTTTYTANGEKVASNTYTVTLDENAKSHTVTFENERIVVPPMGLSDNMAPFAAMTLAGLAAAVIFFLPRRRRQ